MVELKSTYGRNLIAFEVDGGVAYSTPTVAVCVEAIPAPYSIRIHSKCIMVLAWH